MNPSSHQLPLAPRSWPVLDLNVELTEEPMEMAPPAAALHPPSHQLPLAPMSRPLLDLNVEATEEPMEVAPPVAALPPQPARLRPAYTVEQIFQEFSYRRAALIRAITTDEEILFSRCNPALESMCLYGHTDGNWEVRKPQFLVPLGQPKPTLGINLVRDKMERVQWLQEIAKLCDSWLISISFFTGSNLNADGRERLFTKINCLQTVHEAFIDSDTYRRLCFQDQTRCVDDVENDRAEDEDDYFCERCGNRYHANGFWICCDICMVWFHGKCVQMTPEQENHMELYECPECIAEKSGHDYE